MAWRTGRRLAVRS
uniref:Uncharacterized protein n=1 Tax=Arundo donax TaxID=35708 RepID=A0A0A8Z5I8_ARUDO